MSKEKSTRKFNLLTFILARITFIPYLALRYRVSGKNKNLLKKLKPPYLLIPNHVSMFDPPMVNIFLLRRVHFVMSDANMRTKLGRWVYGRLCNVIPKTKAMSDSSTVRKIVQLVRKKRIICIFAEGRSSWDGVTHDIFFSTAKLIKILKIPVVVPLISGGYLSQPRWATSMRRGKIIINYKKIFDGPELAKMTAQQIHVNLVDELWHDDYEFQRKSGQKYKTKKGAEYLERLLFICPECRGKATLRSEGNRFFCTRCGFETLWTSEGLLKPTREGKHPVRSVTGWTRWQNAICEREIKQMANRADETPIFMDDDVILQVGHKLQPLKTVARGKMALYLDRFSIFTDNGKEIHFPLEKVEGVQVLLANKFEFYFDGALYKFKFTDPRTSGYKYMCAVQKLAPEKTELL